MNMAFFSNPRVDELLAEARRSTDDAERAALYRQAEDIVLEEAPWAVTYSFRFFELWQPYLPRLPPAPDPGPERAQRLLRSRAAARARRAAASLPRSPSRRSTGAVGRASAARAPRSRSATGAAVIATILRRLAWAVFTVWAVVTATFVIFSVLPEDPARAVAGAQARPADVARIREQLALDRPILVRYARYMKNLVRFGAPEAGEDPGSHAGSSVRSASISA